MSTLWLPDWGVQPPDRAGFRMFPREPSVCVGWDAVRVPPRAQCFRRSGAHWASDRDDSVNTLSMGVFLTGGGHAVSRWPFLSPRAPFLSVGGFFDLLLIHCWARWWQHDLFRAGGGGCGGLWFFSRLTLVHGDGLGRLHGLRGAFQARSASWSTQILGTPAGGRLRTRGPPPGLSVRGHWIGASFW
jgi:hypothetical protein